MKTDIFDLRYRARAEDLRNRVVPPTPIIVVRLDSVQECDCGNRLTIEDRGYRCRQCVLAVDATTPRKITITKGE